MLSDRLFYLFVNFVQQLPSLLALLACIIFAVTRRKRYPKVAIVVATGLTILLVHAIFFLFVYNFVPSWIRFSYIQQGGSFEQINRTMQTVYLVLGLISNTAAAVGFGVLLMGIFMRRTPDELRET